MKIDLNNLQIDAIEIDEKSFSKKEHFSLLEPSDNFLKYFPCDIKGDITYPFVIGMEDCEQFCKEVLYNLFKGNNACPLKLITLQDKKEFEFLQQDIEKLNCTFEIINDHPE